MGLDERNAATAREIGSVTAVSLHDRRGDYVTDPGARTFLGTLPLDYYAAAARLIRERAPIPHFFVFSDDPAWCRENLEARRPHDLRDARSGPRPRGHEAHDALPACTSSRTAPSAGGAPGSRDPRGRS